MFSINIKLAFRNLVRFKTYSILNILGLSVGLAFGIFVIIDTNYGLNYDKFHPNWPRMYKLLGFIGQGNGKSFTDFRQSMLVGEGLMQEASEIENYNRQIQTSLYFKKDDSPILDKGMFTDQNFFEVFNYELLEGNKSTALDGPGSIVISQRLANKLFGNKPALGQLVPVLLNEKQDNFKVTGVFKNVEHSILNFEFVLPIALYSRLNPQSNSFTDNCCEYIFTLKANSDINQVNKKIKNYLQGKDKTMNKTIFMQPMSEVQLYYYENGERHMNRLLIILITAIIGGFILLISIFNFTNMAIAMGVKRNREVGIKKVLGSSRGSIILQFLSESLLICLIALFFAFILIETFLPFFNNSAYVHLEIEYSNIGKMLLYIVFAVMVGVVACIYPAILLASTSPVKILKGVTGNNQKISVSRQGLIVFQFFTTIILLVGLFVFNQQAKFVETKDIGINRENIVYFQVSNEILKHKSVFHSDLQSVPGISSISWANQLPIRIYSSTTNVLWDGKQADQKMDFWTINTDSAFITTFKPKLAEGRFFSSAFVSDTANYIINEEAVKSMQLKNPIGKIISVDNQKGIIIGIVKNFNSLQIQAPYLPVVIMYKPGNANMVYLKFKGDKNVIREKVEKIYKSYESYIPIEFKTVDDAYNDLNRFSSTTAQVITIFTLMALFLACMGLYGLASFTIESRTKEIGIRKSNGASTFEILKMFLKSYSKWIIIASCIALPLSFFAWNTLLSIFFVFRIPFPISSLIITPVIVLLIAWSTIIWQSWKAANKNPVDALRYE